MAARRIAATVLLVVALAADAAAAEPGWQPMQDLGFASLDQSFGYLAPGAEAHPLGGGTFLVLVREHDNDRNVDEALVYAVGAGTRQVAGPIELWSAGDIDLATSPNGAARLVWMRPGPPPYLGWDLVMASRPPGGDFGPPVVLESGYSGAAPHIAMNASGEAVIARSAWDAGLQLVFVTPDGQPSAPVVVRASEETQTSSTRADNGDVILSDAGEALVVFGEADGTRTCNPDLTCDDWHYTSLLRSVHGNASGFSPPATLVDTARGSTWFNLAGDAQGGAIVGWAADDRSGVAIRAPGGEFAPALEGAFRGDPPAVATARNGATIAAYEHFESPTQPMQILFRLGNTTSGELGAALSSSGLPTGMPRVAADWNGERVLVWPDVDGIGARWIAADGSLSPWRFVSCDRGNRLQNAAVSAGRGLALAISEFADAHGPFLRIFGAFAEPGIATVDCAARPAPPAAGLGGPSTPPVSLVTGYQAYANKRRRATALLSPPAPDRSARLPASWSNGASDNATLSQDNRNARLIAYDSIASNLVRGDRNPARDVFVVRRARGGGNLWGRISLASVGPRGRPANGPSSRPSLDGETHSAPHCVAFQSRATNLSKRDRTTDSDVYVRDLRRGRTILLSPGLPHAQGAVVDGSCKTVAFEARGSVWVTPVLSGTPWRVARGADPDQQTNGQGVAYVRRGQVWYRPFVVRRRHHRLVVVPGRERLVSATTTGRPGNGRSANPSLDDSGAYVAFQSAATDLCVNACTGVTGDRNGPALDVFRRTLSARAPTKDRMQMVNYSFSARRQYGESSFNPVISGAGENVVYESKDAAFGEQSPLALPGEREHVLRTWSFPRARGTGEVRVVLRQCGIFLCRAAPVMRPAISSRGNYLAFTSRGIEFCDPVLKVRGGRPQCPRFTDVYLQFAGPSHEGYPLG